MARQMDKRSKLQIYICTSRNYGGGGVWDALNADLLISYFRGRFDKMLTNDDRTGRWVQKYENFADVILERSLKEASLHSAIL